MDLMDKIGHFPSKKSENGHFYVINDVMTQNDVILKIWKLLQCVCGNIFYKCKNQICTQFALVPALIDKIGHFPPKKSKNRHFGINYDVIAQNGVILEFKIHSLHSYAQFI